MSKTWEMVPLGNVLSERQEKPSEEALASGKIRIVAKIGFDDGKIQLRVDGQTKTGMILIRPGDLVVSGINAAKGAIALYGEENSGPIAATIHYGAYIPQKNRINVKYLWWLLRSRAFRDILQEYVPGGIKTELKAKRLLPVPIPLPQLSEQERIVAKIEQLAAKIGEAQGLRRRTSEEVEFLQSRSIDFVIDKSTSKRQPLERLLSEPLMNGLSLPASKINREAGILFAKVGVVNSGAFNPFETKRVDIIISSESPYWLKSGDIVVSRGNSTELVGRAAVYEGNPPKCAFPDLLIRVRLNPELAEPRFISTFFQSQEVRRYVESQVSGTSPTMKKISQPKLKALSVPVISLAEQRRIVAYLDSLQAQVDRLKVLQAQTAAELEALLPAILDRAFKGEL
ncbi:restriction endonuclease subunit S [bacterium]|nr:restriction endonuclease subunit S [bacterium]